MRVYVTASVFVEKYHEMYTLMKHYFLFLPPPGRHRQTALPVTGNRTLGVFVNQLGAI